MNSQELHSKDIPDAPGVYFFKRDSNILYIGKATSLKDRVKSYFSKDLAFARSPLITNMVEQADDVVWEQTDSVLEALILEANLIKKHQPVANTKEKDNKSFNYVVITNEDFPKILFARGRELETGTINEEVKEKFGPFPHGAQLKEAMKIVRKIFPYRDTKCQPGQGKPCFNRQIGLCPGVCTGEISKQDYAKTVRHIKLFFEGKKKVLITTLEKEMKAYGKLLEFEKADKIKKTIFALNHIQDIALIKQAHKVNVSDAPEYRIEAYDIAHLAGKSVVGVMIVVEGSEAKKSDYRKFKIKGLHGGGVDDTGNLREILERRFYHLEWPMPNLIVVDGSTAQINVAQKVLGELNLNIEIVAVTKDDRHKAREVKGDVAIVHEHRNEILLANAEAHRFAIGYHKKVRNARFL